VHFIRIRQDDYLHAFADSGIFTNHCADLQHPFFPHYQHRSLPECLLHRPPLAPVLALCYPKNHHAMIPVTQKAPNTCNYCRIRKQRCDRILPSCSRCTTYVAPVWYIATTTNRHVLALASFNSVTTFGPRMRLVSPRIVYCSFKHAVVALTSPREAAMSSCMPGTPA
jgi:hypothetical protein